MLLLYLSLSSPSSRLILNWTVKTSQLTTNFTNSDAKDISGKKGSSPLLMYDRLLNLASASLAQKEFGHDSSNPWNEPSSRASAWKPCADRQTPKDKESPKKSNGYLLVSANGGLNQQRVAVCNAVAVASLLNATLVVPRFLYSSVWKDPSQFGDIYQDEHFINTLKDDVAITKDLPPHLRSVDLEAIGSVITDAHLVKEAKPSDYVRLVLPVLLQNGVVHLLGFGNRFGFDPLPHNLQKLRCKCNFHALKFVPKIQEAGSLLVRRIREYDSSRNRIDKELLGNFMPDNYSRSHDSSKGPSKYLALHLRFEVDMVAYSLCEFGGGESERKELQAYRETHFPLLLQRLKGLRPVSPEELRISGRCPLTPEEAGLLLAGLGLERGTYIYLAGSQIYDGKSRMKPFTSLYPNLVTKEDLLASSEIEPFRNFSSQLAALDFIACATADDFAMTDSGSQLSSLVSGFRTYFGGGHAPTLRPNKKRLSAILLQNDTISWNTFQLRVKKMIEEGQRVHVRRYGQSIYRQPRSPECMCKSR
ncbi:O-fucosyltransferase 8 isoform X2 [Beta vulgaris subsp. vulgaris]|uniref:O-fucosyltransferase 8 isoform X2 n=1 Tax=Beta vulgaris subsp. vulgaris TaxID=3555 RepID=UPI002036ACEA|nr:O-fucosyltransferase 8 isoform X2 [Beta vulgaris subsp. vulgaris]